jgi:nucleotide-binding universal stress UspA family protein
MTGRTQGAGLMVVGVDGAEASLAAVRWAVREASWYQARMHLVFASLRYRRAAALPARCHLPWDR